MSDRSPPRRFSNLDLVEACDNFPYDEPTAIQNLNFYTLYLPYDSRPHGYLTPTNVALLPWTKDFHIDHTARTVTLVYSSSETTATTATSSSETEPSDEDLSTFSTKAFEAVINSAITLESLNSNNNNNKNHQKKRTFPILAGKHSEPYRIPGSLYPISLERFAAPLFGVTTRGVHLTIFYYNNNNNHPTLPPGELCIFVPRRCLEMFTFPGKYDSTVAGGVPAHETPLQTLVHEADEEASLSDGLIRERARPAGVLTYLHWRNDSCTPSSPPSEEQQQQQREASDGYICGDCVYVYDLELTSTEVSSSEITLTPKDGEVEKFDLLTLSEVKEALAKGEFKPNSALVMLDFLIRRGFLTPENEPDYVQIINRLHRRLPFPLAGRTRTGEDVVYTLL